VVVLPELCGLWFRVVDGVVVVLPELCGLWSRVVDGVVVVLPELWLRVVDGVLVSLLPCCAGLVIFSAGAERRSFVVGCPCVAVPLEVRCSLSFLILIDSCVLRLVDGERVEEFEICRDSLVMRARSFFGSLLK
jgi:hypothetical protein